MQSVPRDQRPDDSDGDQAFWAQIPASYSGELIELANGVSRGRLGDVGKVSDLLSADDVLVRLSGEELDDAKCWKRTK